MNQLPSETCLPPNNNTQLCRGYLNITPLSLTFFKNQTSNTLLRLQFWGSSSPNYLHIETTEIFPVVASLNKFKLYLIDSKSIQIQVVDNRNYKAIACAFLNWMMHLRPMDDKQLYQQQSNEQQPQEQKLKAYYLPFIDEQMQQTLPLYKPGPNKLKNNEKIGELKIKWSCKIFDLPETKIITPPQLNTEENMYNIRVSTPGHKENNSSKQASICKIDMIQEDNYSPIERHKSAISSIHSQNNSVLLGLDYRNKNYNNPPNKDARISAFSQKIPKEIVRPPKSQTSYSHQIQTKHLQAELVRIRMEMSDYSIDLDHKQSQRILKISFFEQANKNVNLKDLSHLDIVSEINSQKSKYRLFPESIAQNKAVFNSSLGAKAGSSLLFSAAFKKPKDIAAKAQFILHSSGEIKDLSMYTNQGMLLGFLRIASIQAQKIQQKQQMTTAAYEHSLAAKIEVKPETISLKKQTQPAITFLKKEQKKTPQLLSNYVPAQKESIPQNSNKNEMYYLILFQEEEPLSYEVFGKKIEGSNNKKWAVWPEKEIADKTLILSIYNPQQILLSHEILIQRIEQTNYNRGNMTCSLLFKKSYHKPKTTLFLYSGSTEQLLFFIQELTQPPQYPTLPIPTAKLPPQPQYQQKYQQRLNTETIERKLRTESGTDNELKFRRMTQEKGEGESASGHQLELPHALAEQHLQQSPSPQEQPDQPENFYLVDLLTRFLEELTTQTIPEQIQIDKSFFVQSVTNRPETELQPELVEMILSIFQQEIGSPVKLDLIRQSIKAFSTFLSLYIEQRTTLLKQILTFEPKAAEKIKNNAELGMINESILWKKALNKVTNSLLRQKINKLYKISSYAPTEADLIVDDLALSQTKLRSIDICNLGMLVKQWVEQFLSQLPKDVSKRIKEKINQTSEDNNTLNITTLNYLLQQEISLRLSLWESLMLIEQIKSCYGCDLDVGQGLITAESFNNWIESVTNRQLVNNPSNLNSSRASGEVIKQKEVWDKGSLIKSKFRTLSKFQEQNKTQYKYNDSDIMDIANLMKRKEEEQQKYLGKEQWKDTILQPNELEELNKSFKKEQNSQKIINKSSQVNMSASTPAEQLIRPIRKPQPQLLQKVITHTPKLFYMQVIEINLYSKENLSSNALLKFTATLGEQLATKTHQNYIYLTKDKEYSQANGVCFQLKFTQTKQESLYLQLYAQQQRIGCAALDWQEYTNWHNRSQEDQNKKLVIYNSARKIIGKIEINLTKKQISPINKQIDTDKQLVKLKVIQSVPFTSNLVFMKSKEQSEIKLQIGQEYELLITKPLYSKQLIFYDSNKEGSCSVLFEELYLKKYRVAEYPLVSLVDGCFKANLTIEMAIEGQPLGQYLYRQPQPIIKVNQFEQISSDSFDHPLPKQNRQSNTQSLSSQLKQIKSNDLLKQIDSIYLKLKARYGDLPSRPTN